MEADAERLNLRVVIPMGLLRTVRSRSHNLNCALFSINTIFKGRSWMPVKGDKHILSSVHGFPYTEHTEYGRIAPNTMVHAAAAIHKLY